MSWLFDALIAMILFSVMNILYKVIDVPGTELFFLISILSGIILGIILGVKGSELEIKDYKKILLIILAGVSLTFGQLFAISSIRKINKNPGIAILVINLNFLLVYLLLIPIFGTKPSIKEILGVFLAAISFVLVAI